MDLIKMESFKKSNNPKKKQERRKQKKSQMESKQNRPKSKYINNYTTCKWSNTLIKRHDCQI